MSVNSDSVHSTEVRPDGSNTKILTWREYFALELYTSGVFLSRIFYPFWPFYGQKFRFGTFDQGATRWVEYENFDLERVFRFGALHQWLLKFFPGFFLFLAALRPKIPIWYFRLGCDQMVLLTGVWPETNVRYFRPWCDHVPISVLSINGATNGGYPQWGEGYPIYGIRFPFYNSNPPLSHPRPFTQTKFGEKIIIITLYTLPFIYSEGKGTQSKIWHWIRVLRLRKPL